MAAFLAVLLLGGVSAPGAWAGLGGSIAEPVFAPYVDALQWPPFSLENISQKTGQKYFTLAFVLSDGQGNPAWGGVIGMEQDWFADQIAQLRGEGGDVIVSFGGANGTELALDHSDAASLQAAYQSVIDRYGLKWVDFDIEGWAVAERVSVDLRNQAIRGLQEANPDLKVAYCLPVMPQGLTADGLYVLENARDHGVRIDVVNVMAMDYGDGIAPDPEGRMGQYAIDAAQNTLAQLRARGIEAKIGVTPMIGQNDVVTERFYLSDAQELLNWAMGEGSGEVGLLAMWSANRDNGGCPGGPAQAGCSGIDQDEFAFTSLFSAFTGSAGGNVPPMVSITSPENGASFPQGGTVAMAAEASDSDGQVVSVEFLVNGSPAGVDDQAPYALDLPGLATGTYTLAARALDDGGAERVSSPVTVYVGSVCQDPAWNSSAVYWGRDKVSHNGRQWEAKWWTRGEEPGTTGLWGVWKDLGPCGGNLAPLVSIVAPVSGQEFLPGEFVLIRAEAQDPDGQVARVAFYNGEILLGEVADAPFDLTLIDPAPGTLTLTALATDDEGLTTRSDPVTVTVLDDGGSGGSCQAPAWDPNQNWSTYQVGDQRTNGGKLWECTNTAYSFWEPSGPYGHFGWAFVQNCD